MSLALGVAAVIALPLAILVGPAAIVSGLRGRRAASGGAGGRTAASAGLMLGVASLALLGAAVTLYLRAVLPLS